MSFWEIYVFYEGEIFGEGKITTCGLCELYL